MQSIKPFNVTVLNYSIKNVITLFIFIITTLIETNIAPIMYEVEIKIINELNWRKNKNVV